VTDISKEEWIQDTIKNLQKIWKKRGDTEERIIELTEYFTDKYQKEDKEKYKGAYTLIHMTPLLLRVGNKRSYK